MSSKMMITNCLSTICCLLLLSASASVSAVTFNAFADVVFEHSDRAGDISGFELGNLDLWGTHVIDEDQKFKAFIELVVESEDDESVIDLERLWIEYAIDPKFKIRAGRFHTALGYWNRTFHHGAHMQVSINRPLFLEFEDEDTAILPVHTIGLMAIKNFESAIGKLHIELQLGNGSHIHEHSPGVNMLNPSASGDEDNDKEIVVRLLFSPRFIDGLGLGISYLSQKISLKDIAGDISELVEQNILVADISYIANGTEIFLEYYAIENEDTTGIARTSTAWYAQGAYTFSEVWTPYARYEFLEDIDTNDPYFNTLGTFRYRHTVLGVRYDLSDNSSIKLEGVYMKLLDSADDSMNSYRAQWTFAF